VADSSVVNAEPATSAPTRKRSQELEPGDARPGSTRAGMRPTTAAQRALMARNSCTRCTALPATVRVKKRVCTAPSVRRAVAASWRAGASRAPHSHLQVQAQVTSRRQGAQPRVLVVDIDAEVLGSVAGLPSAMPPRRRLVVEHVDQVNRSGVGYCVKRSCCIAAPLSTQVDGINVGNAMDVTVALSAAHYFY
jgi:hypothetical protein